MVYNPVMSKLSVKARPTISMAAIRRYAKRIVERFQPDAIYLFGSYANRTAHADSDVDLMVVMPARNQLDQAARIQFALPADFPLDIIVRTPERWQWGLDEGESFIREIITEGIVLHDARDPSVGEKGRRRLSNGPVTHKREQTAPRSGVL